MKIDDIICLAFFMSFGVWWLIYPRSVIDFYIWFHKGTIIIPNPKGIRYAGCIWILLLLIVMFYRIKI